MANNSVTVSSKADIVAKYQDEIPDGMFFTQTVTVDKEGENYNPAKYRYIINNIPIQESDLGVIEEGEAQQAPEFDTDLGDTSNLNDVGDKGSRDNGRNMGTPPEFKDRLKDVGGEIESQTTPQYVFEEGTNAPREVSITQNQAEQETQDQADSGEDQESQELTEEQRRVNLIYEATVNQNEGSPSDEESDSQEQQQGYLSKLGVTKKQAAIGSAAALVTGLTLMGDE